MAAAPLINRLKLAAQATGRPQPPEPTQTIQSVRSDTKDTVGERPVLEPEHGVIVTAASASPAWLLARDAFIGHLMSCSKCHAPVSRYCVKGAQVKAIYEHQVM